MRLLRHNVDVVVPIAPCKVPPFMPCMMHGPKNGGPWWQPDMPLYNWDELSGEGLMALPKGDFIGQAGMLVKKKVLDVIGDPWFRCGQLDPGRLQEDLHFCHVVQELGFTVWIDREIVLDHYMPMAVTARKHEGVWAPALQALNGVTMVLPDVKPRLKTINGVEKWTLPSRADYAAQH